MGIEHSGGQAMMRWVTPLFVSLLIWDPFAASAATPTCVAKLAFSSDDKSDSGTNAFVKQVLTGLGYKIIDDWLLFKGPATPFYIIIIVLILLLLGQSRTNTKRSEIYKERIKALEKQNAEFLRIRR